MNHRKHRNRVTLLLILAAICAGIFFGIYRIRETAREEGRAMGWEAATAEADARHAKELEALLKVADQQVAQKLEAISEFSTYLFTYTNQTTCEDVKSLFNTGLHIPGTKNSVELTYTGIIKAGYDISKIQYKLDEHNKTLTFTLPEVEILDNYIILDDLECSQDNGLLNPIEVSDIIAHMAECEEAELTIALSSGIKEQAEVQMKRIIENYMADLPGYRVQFTV